MKHAHLIKVIAIIVDIFALYFNIGAALSLNDIILPGFWRFDLVMLRRDSAFFPVMINAIIILLNAVILLVLRPNETQVPDRVE